MLLDRVGQSLAALLGVARDVNRLTPNYALRVFLLRVFAMKNSQKRRHHSCAD